MPLRRKVRGLSAQKKKITEKRIPRVLPKGRHGKVSPVVLSTVAALVTSSLVVYGASSGVFKRFYNRIKSLFAIEPKPVPQKANLKNIEKKKVKDNLKKVEKKVQERLTKENELTQTIKRWREGTIIDVKKQKNILIEIGYILGPRAALEVLNLPQIQNFNEKTKTAIARALRDGVVKRLGETLKQLQKLERYIELGEEFVKGVKLYNEAAMTLHKHSKNFSQIKVALKKASSNWGKFESEMTLILTNVIKNWEKYYKKMPK